MADFDLDLRRVEDEMDEERNEGDGGGQVVLGVLNGTTPSEEWSTAVEQGHVLVLAVEGDLNQLAAGFASDVRDLGGNLLQFRDFLIVTPAGVEIDRSRLE